MPGKHVESPNFALLGIFSFLKHVSPFLHFKYAFVKIIYLLQRAQKKQINFNHNIFNFLFYNENCGPSL